jgi:hypothetical protein
MGDSRNLRSYEVGLDKNRAGEDRLPKQFERIERDEPTRNGTRRLPTEGASYLLDLKVYILETSTGESRQRVDLGG